MTLKEHDKVIQALLKRIAVKSKNFAAANQGKFYGDLGWVAGELESIDRFLNDIYLKK